MKLTVLTRKPLSVSILDLLMNFLKHPRHIFRLIIEHRNIHGHPAVTKSLLNGLDKINYKYKYNPILGSSVSEKVLVLSNIDALQECILLKKKGKIKSILAGPNIVVKANENNSILGSKEIDKIIVPSQWVKVAYEEECPRTKGRIFIWPSGVDIKRWAPKNTSNRKTVLLYRKVEDELLEKDFYQNIEKIVISHGYKIINLKYGNYKKEQFYDSLNESICMIYVSKSESQGIALLEAWSMNVPTLVWKSNINRINNKVYKKISTAPYLNKFTGYFWSNVDNLENLFNKINNQKQEPREWVKTNQTEEICAGVLTKEIDKIYES